MPNKNCNKKRKLRRYETAIDDFAEALENFPDMVDQDQTTSYHNDNDKLRLEKNNRSISIICPICNMIQTQH